MVLRGYHSNMISDKATMVFFFETGTKDSGRSGLAYLATAASVELYSDGLEDCSEPVYYVMDGFANSILDG